MRSRRQFSINLVRALAGSVTALYAQTEAPESLLTPDVVRVGSRLACRCGTCRNTVGDCAMLHCFYCSPKRERIYEMKQQGLSDDQIVNTFVKEDGIVTLASPPTQGLGPIVTWVGPSVALLLGFGVYSWFVRRHRKEPETLMPADQAVLDRFQAQIDRELNDSPLSGGPSKR
jgi:cytochrome c-type biogenesis protein CcmH/NrfF